MRSAWIACSLQRAALSMTGEKYVIRFGDSRVVAVAQLLHDQLGNTTAGNVPNHAPSQPSSRPAQQNDQIHKNGGVQRQRENLQRSETMMDLPDLERNQRRGGDDGEVFGPAFAQP